MIRRIRRNGLGAAIGTQPGQCPAYDIAKNLCGDPSGFYPCTQVRECDEYTGALHFQYALPGGNAPNANIWNVNQDNSWTYLGPDTKPAQYQPVSVGTPVSTPTWNPAVSVTAAPATAPVTKVTSTPLPSSPSAPVSSPALATPVTYRPALTWRTSGDPSAMRPGDRWTVTIFGAQPGSAVVNTAVWTDGSGQVHTGSSQVGKADSQGNFSFSGQMSAGEIGTWAETWKAGDQLAGHLSFTVATPAQTSQAPAAADPMPPPSDPNTGDQLLSTGNPFDASGFIAQLPQPVQDAWTKATAIAPWYVWLGGAGAAVYFAMESNKRKRRS